MALGDADSCFGGPSDPAHWVSLGQLAGPNSSRFTAIYVAGEDTEEPQAWLLTGTATLEVLGT